MKQIGSINWPPLLINFFLLYPRDPLLSASISILRSCAGPADHPGVTKLRSSDKTCACASAAFPSSSAIAFDRLTQ